MMKLTMQLLRRSAALAAAITLIGVACGSDGMLEAETTGTAAPVTATSGPPTDAPIYLALGDSLAVGVGATDWRRGGYVPRLLDLLNDDRGGAPLQLVNVGRSGAGTLSMIEGGQLAEAVAMIDARAATASRGDDVQVITVGIGGNDGFGLVALCDGVVDDACLVMAAVRIRDVQKNLLFILETLQAAAGPDVPIAVMTYYNPLVHAGCPLHEFKLIGDVVLEGEEALGLSAGVNDEIRAAAVAAGVAVAEIGTLSEGELTGDCLHASDPGHARIAQAFRGALSG